MTQFPKVSLCMIVKNEEANLPACLESVKGLFDEIIVVDTGSTDRTKEIALEYGAKVNDFEWIDDFSAARNKSLEFATGQWIFWLDADHRIDQENYHLLKILFGTLKDEKIAFIMNEKYYLPASTFPTYNPYPRLFRSHSLLRWKYRLHEQISPSLRSLGFQFQKSDIVIQHIGYEDPAVHKKKIERDYRILEIEKNEIDKNKELLPHVYYHLSRYYREINQPIESPPLLQYALNNTPKNSDYYYFIIIELMKVYKTLGNWENALNACKQAQALMPNSGNLLFEESHILEKLGHLDQAIERLLELCSPNTNLVIDFPALLDMAHYNLAIYLHKKNNFQEAERHLVIAIEHNPKIGIVWLELTGLYISQMRWTEALNACQKAKALMPNDASAHFWECLIQDNLGNNSQAQTLLLQLIENYPSLNINNNKIHLAEIYHNLGVSYYKQNDYVQAENSWNRALQENPQFDFSWLALINLWIKQARWETLSQAIAYLETTVHYDEMAYVIKSKLLAAQDRIPEALSLLKDVITIHPQMIWPRIILAEISINAPQDLPYTKKILLEALSLDPNNVVAKQLLSSLNQ